MMKDMLKRWRWAIGITALLIAGLVVAFWPEPKLVDTASVSRGPLAVGVTDDGVTRAEDYYVVSAPVTGYLERIELEVGDRVARGARITGMTGRPATPLDRRTEQELRGALAAARAAESGAAASLAQARRDLARAEELARRGFLPRAQLEAARTRVTGLVASLQERRAEIVRTRAMLSGPSEPGSASVAVRAPASGSVLSVPTESEGVVAEGTALLTVGDASRIEVVVDLLSREAVRVNAGDRTLISEWGGPAPLVGHVKRVEPFGTLKVSALGIEEQRVNVIIGIDREFAAQATKLGHGYQIDATIILWSRRDALRVPIGALFRGGEEEWRVFVFDHGRARERTVRIGHIGDEFAEVLSGLGAGEAVVLNPANSLENGARIAKR